MERLFKIAFGIAWVLSLALAFYFGAYKEKYDAALFWLAVSFYIIWSEQG